MSRQCAGSVLMVSPVAFGFNEETAASNPMQQVLEDSAPELNRRARVECSGLARALENEGVEVLLAEDTAEPAKPDALFPNNWVSFHADGTLVLYPMLSAHRRLERRAELVRAACERFGFEPRRRLDLSAEEHKGRFLEGTGSLVLDHVAGIAYACRSPRTDESLAREWARLMGFEAVVFDATDERGQPYYHTNVMMWIGTRGAVACLESVAGQDRARLRSSLGTGGRELIEIDRAQVSAFAGNMLELATWDEALGDSSVLVMSAAARAVVAGPQLQRICGLRRYHAGRAGADHRARRRRERALHGGGSAGDHRLNHTATIDSAAPPPQPLVQRIFGALADGALHSGEQLAAAQDVSRSAVWKTVGALQQLGLSIESVPHRGYRLSQAAGAARCNADPRSAGASLA